MTIMFNMLTSTLQTVNLLYYILLSIIVGNMRRFSSYWIHYKHRTIIKLILL